MAAFSLYQKICTSVNETSLSVFFKRSFLQVFSTKCRLQTQIRHFVYTDTYNLIKSSVAVS